MRTRTAWLIGWACAAAVGALAYALTQDGQLAAAHGADRPTSSRKPRRADTAAARPLANPTKPARTGRPRPSNAAVKLDDELSKYRPVESVSGTIKSVGSDSMNNLMAFWTQGFRKFYPNVQVEVEGKGSSTAPPALIAGTANFGPMSREMKSKEIDDFEASYGYKPTALKTSIDMLAVYVHQDNPIAGLTLRQLDAIFSKNRKGGAAKDIRTWGQLGLRGKWASTAINLYGRNSASGTNGYFKEHALFGGDYKDSVKQLPGSASVVQAIARNPGAIGYSGIGYLTADVRAVALAYDADEEFVPALPRNGYTGDYPLSRHLLIYVNYEPDTPLDPLRREFIRYVFSREGQGEVIKDGYLPVTSKTAAKALASVGIGVDGAAKE